MRRVERDPAKPSALPDDRLPKRPGPARPIERPIIEADPKKSSERRDPGAAIARERTGVVLSEDLIAISQEVALRRHVGDGIDRHQRVRLAARETQDAPRPVVLERARDDADAVGGKTAGDR